jgi:hypothetical protein
MNQAEWYQALYKIASDPALSVNVRLFAAQCLRTPAPKMTDVDWYQHWLTLGDDIDNDMVIENDNNNN